MTNFATHITPSRNRSLGYGVLGFLFFNATYITILLLASRVTKSLEDLLRLWPWGLVIGSLFSVQIGLFSHVRQVITSRNVGFGRFIAVSGTGSVGSMVACCSHLLTLFFPLLGVSLLSGFLAEIQESLIYLAIFINLFAIVSQLIIMRNHGVYSPDGRLAKTSVDHLKKIRIIIVIAMIPVMALALFSTLKTDQFSFHKTVKPSLTETGDSGSWGELSNSRNNVTISSKPILHEFESRLGFSISLQTHTVDLAFRMTEIAELTINGSTVVQPVSWEGPEPGGHHISGELWFSGVSIEPESIRLELKDIADVDWVFEWAE